jgi:hypothetical protein
LRKLTKKDSRAEETREDHKVGADKNNCNDHRNRVKNLEGNSNSVHPDNSNNVRNSKDHLGSSRSHQVNSHRDPKISSSRQSPDSKEVTSQEIPNSAKAPEAIRKKTDALNNRW